MSRKNPAWGAPLIHGESLKLGIDVGESSATKYMVRCRKPPSDCITATNDKQPEVDRYVLAVSGRSPCLHLSARSENFFTSRLLKPLTSRFSWKTVSTPHGVFVRDSGSSNAVLDATPSIVSGGKLVAGPSSHAK